MGSKEGWTYYDNFRAEGAEFVNGSFEKKSEDGKCIGWKVITFKGCTAADKQRVGISSPADGAAEGVRVGCANHDNRISQIIKVKKDQPVTVTFQARASLPVTVE